MKKLRVYLPNTESKQWVYTKVDDSWHEMLKHHGKYGRLNFPRSDYE
jgi:hypothetical protein